MKSRLNRLAFYFLCICFSFLFSIACSASTPESVAPDDSQAKLQYQLLRTEFKHQRLRNRSLSEYPDNYAGSYIQDDGNLVVLLTEVSPTSISSIRSFTRSENTIVRKASVSYNDLVSYRDLIIERFESLKSESTIGNESNTSLSTLISSFVGIGIEERNNRICVLLTDISQTNIQAFRTYISTFNRISFERSDHASEDTTTSQPGTYIRAADREGSIGYRCTYNNGTTTLYGFTTAAHVAGSLNQPIYITPHQSGVTATTCGTVRCLQYSGTIDVAFVENNSGFSVSNLTPANKIIASSWFTYISEGSSVLFHGDTSGETSGVVRNNEFYFTTESGVALTDMLRCNYDAAAGDSGGIVFSLINGDYAVVGIHHGRVSVLQGLNGRSIASKAQNIYTTLGIAPY